MVGSLRQWPEPSNSGVDHASDLSVKPLWKSFDAIYVNSEKRYICHLHQVSGAIYVRLSGK